MVLRRGGQSLQSSQHVGGGTTLAGEALTVIGYVGDNAACPARFAGYLEAHIEQADSRGYRRYLCICARMRCSVPPGSSGRISPTGASPWGPEDIAAGANVLLHATLSLAGVSE